MTPGLYVAKKTWTLKLQWSYVAL